MTMHVARYLLSYWQWISIESSQLDEWCQSVCNMEWNRLEGMGQNGEQRREQ